MQNASQPIRPAPRLQDAVAIGCFFLSGFAGLVYEICWIRKSTLVFGSTTFAVSTVVAVFFLGLALGSYLFGRIGARVGRPLRLYAIIEIGLGILAALSLAGFGFVESVYGAIYRSASASGVQLIAARIVLVMIILLPPTILMGGTLPLFTRQYVVSRSRIARSVGFLYGVNTLGAAAGCAAAGFFLLPTIGLARTLFFAAGVTVACGGIVLTLPLARARKQDVKPKPRGASERIPQANTVALLFFATGFVALGIEVLWTRYLTLLIRNTVLTYTLTLTVVLLGIVLGSIVASGFSDRTARRPFVFGLFQVLTGLSALTVMMLPATAWGRPDELWMHALALLPPAIFSGASFPIAVRMVVDNPATASAGVGRMAAINILGGIVGSLAVGFFGIPLVGLAGTLTIVTGVGVAAGLAAWLRLSRGALPVRATVSAVAVALWIAVPRVTHTRVPADFLGSREALVGFREGYGANLAVIENDGFLQLEIDRLWQGGNRKNHQMMAAHVPMLIHPEPRSVLVIGVGSGQTPSRFLMHDVRRVDCVDIEPTIFDFIGRHFDSRWMNDDRVNLIREDGRNHVRHTAARYDVISLEVGQIYRPGIAYFYTGDFYRLARERLNPGGILSQFVPLPFFTENQFRSVVRTFVEHFPQSILWYNTSELLLLGFKSDTVALGEHMVQRLREGSEVANDLKYSHWGGSDYWLSRPSVFLAGFLAGPAALDRLAANGSVYGDDRPVLDYATSRVDEMAANEVELLDLLSEEIEPVTDYVRFALPPEETREIDTIRRKNLGDIVVSAAVRQVNLIKAGGDYDRIIALLSKALPSNPEHAVGNRMLADAMLYRGRRSEAAAHYRAALAQRPDDARAHYGIGVVFHTSGRLDEAIQHYNEAVRLAPDNPEMHGNLGGALAEQNKLREAIPHFEEALRLRPDFTAARQNLERARAALRAQGN